MTADDLTIPLTAALRAAPELQTAPSVALGIAQDATSDPTSDPVQNAQVVAQVNNTQSAQQATQQVGQKVGGQDLVHKTLGWLGDFGSGVAEGITKPLNMLGAGLREVQHQYRAVHDIEARHGPIAGLLAGLGIGVGAVAGSLIEPGEGTVLGGELAGALVGRLAPDDSWQRTTSGAQYQGSFNRQTGQYEGPAGQVSVGRDLASAVGVQPGTTAFSVASGAADFLADVSLDPLAQVGKAVAAARSAEGLGGPIGTMFSHAPQGDTLALRTQDLEERVAQLPSVKRAFNMLADSSEEDIIKNWPKLRGLAPQLGDASSFDDVVDVFRNALMRPELTGSLMPSMSFTRVPFAKLSAAIQDFGGPGSGAIRSVSSLLPTYFDKATLELTNKGFNLGDPAAIDGVYRLARFSQSRDVAAGLAADFANAMDNPGQQLTIYKNLVRQTLIAKGLPEDSQFITDLIDESAQRAFGGGEAVYGVGVDGKNLSKVAAADGSRQSLGILESQTGKIAFPDFNAITREVRSLNAAKNLYGAADDWLYNHFTQGVFKRLVLLSGGFAQRIAMAETIPTALREGAVNLVRSRLSASVARDLAEDPEEVGHLAAATAKVMGGVDNLIGDPDRTAFVSNLIADNGGHIVAPAIDTTTPSAAVAPVERASRNIYNAYSQIPDKMKLGDSFGIFGHENAQYMDAWQRWLGQVSNDPASQKAAQAYLDAMRAGSSAEDATTAGWQAAKDYWDNQPAEKLNQYGRHFAQPTDGMDSHEAWARAIMENVKGATHAPPDMGAVPHVPLLSNIANGEITPMSTLEQVPDELRPVNVMGRQLLPDTTGTIERIANVGFKRVLDPVINFISREPIYVDAAWKEYQYLKPMVESGDMLAEDARQLAQVRAVNRVLPFIHNTLERSQFSQLARNFMPFWFAQEQSYKRFGRILADDPGAFRQFQLMISGMHEIGSTQQDPNGKSWLVYPGAGFLDQKLTDGLGTLGVPVAGSVPVSFSGQLKSLNTIFPFAEGVRPSFGPLVAIPSHLLENLFPELTPAVHAVIGDQAASGSIYDQLIPNQTLKGMIQALDPGMRSRSMQNAVINTMQNLQYQQNQAMDEWVKAGHSPDDPDAPRFVPPPTASPMEKQTFIDRVKNQTRITFLFKTMLGAVTPTSPVANVGDANLRADLRDQISKKGVNQAVQDFLAAHPDATPYTIFSSTSNVGAPLLATQNAQDWINQNLDLIRKYPDAGAWFIPQDATGKFSQAVYNEQMAQHLRTHKAPDQFLTDMYVAAGNSLFYDQLLPRYRNAVAQATGDPAAMQAADLLAKNPENPVALRAYNQAVSAVGQNDEATAVRRSFGNYLTNVLGPQNPVWWDDFKSADADHRRSMAALEMRQMFATGNVPDSPQTEDLRMLVGQFDRYQQAKIDAATDPTVTQQQLKDSWQGYVAQLATEKPNLKPVINAVFRHL